MTVARGRTMSAWSSMRRSQQRKTSGARNKTKPKSLQTQYTNVNLTMDKTKRKMRQESNTNINKESASVSSQSRKKEEDEEEAAAAAAGGGERLVRDTAAFNVEYSSVLDAPTPGFDSVSSAIADIRQGRFVVVLDDEDRENEGDLILAAEMATTEKLAFMNRYATETRAHVHCCCCCTTRSRSAAHPTPNTSTAKH